MYFEGKAKGLVLNKTNANTLSAVFGDETENWEGKETVLYETEVEFPGAPNARDPLHRDTAEASI